MLITENFNLKNHNTFRMNVLCKTFISVENSDELSKITKEFLDNQKYYILSGGSNTLFTCHYDGVILHPEIKGIEIVENNADNVVIKVAAGESWDDLITFCVNNHFYGLENLTAIPGLVGSAPVQNIGAYGVEVKDSILKVCAFNLSQNKFFEFSNEECKFAYRNSIFKTNHRRDIFITHVYFKLSKKPNFNLSYSVLAKKIEENSSEITIENISSMIREIRDSKLPDYKKIGNCGSFFKNPIISKKDCEKLLEKYPDLVVFDTSDNSKKLAAGQLIEKSGWKGRKIGNVGVYPKQALVLVNYGDATPDEILNLSDMIIRDVREIFNVELEKEINCV